MAGTLSLIMKSLSSCNMHCTYCDADIYSHKRMSFSTLAQIVKKALGTGRNVHFIWHGGEPLLMGKEFYKKAVFLQYKYRQNGQIISNTLQTNGTLLDKDWISFFSKNRFGLGLSIDGPEEIHNKNRILSNKIGTHQKVLDSIDLLRKYNMYFGVLAVVTDDTLRIGARKFFNFFIENNLKTFAILCQRPALINDSTDYIPRSTHSEFVKEIFDLWYNIDDPNIHIRDFESIISALLGGYHKSCLLEGNCIGKYFAVEMNGDVYHCDEFMIDNDYRLGNINVSNFQEIINSQQLSDLKQKNQEGLSQIDCKWFGICNGGCPKDRYVAKMFSNGEKIKCCGYADLINHIQSRLEEEPELAKLKLFSKLS